MALLPRLVHGTSHRWSRQLFSLPDLSSLSPFSSNGSGNNSHQVYHERKIFPYTQRQLYELVADATSYPRFLPFCTNARILRKQSEPAARSHVMDVELTVGFMSFQESYVSKVTCCPYESVEAVAASETHLFKSLNTVWRFQPASAQPPHSTTRVPPEVHPPETSNTAASEGTDSRPTLVTLDLSFEFANPVHAAVSSTVFGQVSKLMVKAFEERCIDIYGDGKE
ncbi:dehydrase and lipid transport-domain-containing protein [Trametes gibbosa]|nr:dehydrase and lipid transport-domain-containing protein [Trametes gibbosa]